ncbi:uncharacterized protein LOC114319104 [Camellia sinensis]|uniref:uncharacterized protein LOC114319104 n=1 Tax=Camellia sinensis TaxID=4442 RepID=UPI00103686C3|nr:uncharacterized protein LOC114319104 [Camellia sinensis]
MRLRYRWGPSIGIRSVITDLPIVALAHHWKKQQQEEGEAKRSFHLLQIFDLKSLPYSSLKATAARRRGNVSNRADSTKIGKKGRDLLRGFSLNYQRWQKNLGSFIENTNTTMVEIAHRIGYSHDLSQQRRLVNAELLKLPMSTT